MAEKNKRGFHTVEEPDMEEYERKLREHRVKVVRRTVILIVTVLAVSAGLWVFMALRIMRILTWDRLLTGLIRRYKVCRFWGEYFKIQQRRCFLYGYGKRTDLESDL